ncbi:hypothetical protein HYPSUDRAFT_649614 [Hypholoma sublateritium FD-334 SS-4]|uniref:O-methyltransferase C-terminal domain-containing protein n=1 Tax=Hypholoma sublateritium (strain FD-334 SS-4) TaxID=945553 RepID=A0A0D2MFU8_HYPSF|nr:hypothetical protein HYPSUDRAFT_649614 [Hypholoma sublateritium FD-334 SS-4]
MTIAVLRSLHEIIGHAIDDIERVYAAHADDPHSAPTSKRSSPTPNATQSPTPPESECGDTSSAAYPTATATQAHTFKGRKTHLSSPSNSGAYASPPPSPSVATIPGAHFVSPTSPKESPKESSSEPQLLGVDFPSLDAPYDGGSLSEVLTTHPTVLEAIGKIVAAAGQLGAMAQTPFLTLCEAAMAYHLPSCMRLLEASHVVEILREAGPGGLNVELISQKNGVAANKLAHVLRLLATHHLLREVSPDVFTLNRLSSLVDSGKTFEQIKTFDKEERPEMKYTDTNGIAAFVGLCTDEIQKSSAYLTETYYLSPSASTRVGADPVRAPFCFAFDTAQSGTGFFGWLEGEAGARPGSEGNSDRGNSDRRRAWAPAPAPPPLQPRQAPPPSSARNAHDRAISGRAGQGALGDRLGQVRKKRATSPADPSGPPLPEAGAPAQEARNPNRFRLERFGKAMSGTDGWEVPGAVLSGFDWASLAAGSVVVDVGGGIGSTSMILATAFAQEGAQGVARRPLQFVIQDRAVVCAMGEKAWKAKCPELLGATVHFQVHDFFTPQPVKDAAVFLLRVVLHDWPDDFARKILLRLREAAAPETKLLIADFVLPLACPDDTSSTGILEGIEGAESVLAPAPLLPNLGKASANVYWMDLTMQVMFNSQERTLREMVTLTLSAGWKVVKVTKTPGSLFGYLVAVPVPRIPDAHDADAGATTEVEEPATNASSMSKSLMDEPGLAHRALEREQQYRDTSSRCGTPTFGSHMRLSSASETLSRLGGALLRPRAVMRSASSPSAAPRTPPSLRPALSLSTSTGKKKRPSPLSVPPAGLHLHGSPTPVQSPRRVTSLTTSPRTDGELLLAQVPASGPAPRAIARRMSLAALRSPSAHGLHVTLGPPPPIVPTLPSARTPLSPGSTRALTRRASQVGLAPFAARSPVPPLPRPVPVSTGPGVEPVSPGSSTQRSPHRVHAGASPVPPPRTPGTLRRRASSAQLPHTVGRRRAGTVAGDGLLRAGTVLRFDAAIVPSAYEAQAAREPAVPGVRVLAAAARIAEHGERQGTGAQQSP